MSEYWKSTPKYWCKHCKAFVVDTKLARTQHEATGKHQGALNRFIRDLHRANEREILTKDAAKREVERLNALTSGKPLPARGGAGGGGAGAGAGGGRGVATTTKWTAGVARPVSEAEQKAQMKQLESLGVALPEEFRKVVALPGEWTTTKIITDTDTTTTTTTPEGPQKRGILSSKGKQVELDSKESIKEDILRKRKADEEARRWEDMDEDERAMKKFKVETKTYPGDAYGGEGEELYALLGAKVAVKKEEGVGSVVKEEVAEDGNVVKEEEEGGYGDTALFSAAAVVKEEAGAQKKLGDGISFKKRKVGNLRKK